MTQTNIPQEDEWATGSCWVWLNANTGYFDEEFLPSVWCVKRHYQYVNVASWTLSIFSVSLLSPLSNRIVKFILIMSL